MITQLRYSPTNTYFITGKKGSIMFDTGWAGTFPALCSALGENDLRLQDVKYLFVSHFHPDHMGIAQNIADTGVCFAVCDVQRGFIHSSDHIFARDKHSFFLPVDDSKVRFFSVEESSELLAECGIDGEFIHTPGHSEDSISLWLRKEKALFTGDLPPLYELEMYKGTETEKSWNRLLALKPSAVYYGHARTAFLKKGLFGLPSPVETDTYELVKRITRLSERGFTAEEISEETGADETFIRDVTRIYRTHPGVSVQGILDRIEIKGK